MDLVGALVLASADVDLVVELGDGDLPLIAGAWAMVYDDGEMALVSGGCDLALDTGAGDFFVSISCDFPSVNMFW